MTRGRNKVGNLSESNFISIGTCIILKNILAIAIH